MLGFYSAPGPSPFGRAAHGPKGDDDGKPVQSVLRFARASVRRLVGGSPAEAGTMIRQTTAIFDTGFHYNTHNRERVGLRIYYEDMQVSDTKWVWQIA